MGSYNRVILLGNLTRDPELRFTPSGTAVADIGLAVNDRVKNASGEWVEQPTFVEVTLWTRTAEIASEYLSKGSPVLIEGRLKLDTWETNQGEKRSKLRVVCERMQMVGPRSGGSGREANRRDSQYSQPAPQGEEEPYDAPAAGPPAGHDDDIPF